MWQFFQLLKLPKLILGCTKEIYGDDDICSQKRIEYANDVIVNLNSNKYHKSLETGHIYRPEKDTSWVSNSGSLVRHITLNSALYYYF